MKGVILAGGTGSRLFPLTKITNKHLLPVYDKPMIYYPVKTLVSAGIRDILIVSGAEHAGDFLRLLGSGKEFGAKFTYEIQENAGGIADALRLAEGFSGGEKIVAILGDNIFEDNFAAHVMEFESGKSESAMVFLKKVPDANRFGVAELEGGKIKGIEEKPKKPKSDYAVTGLYFYPKSVFDAIKQLRPSGRGEYEITDVNNYYAKSGKIKANILKGFWSDAGTFDSLFRASEFVKQKKLQGF
ncbi:MAG: sugar phosphate nucleotidyltransferase [archaeon]|nr:sugar phosphate nucleotidyltransferase [archaeon]